MTDLHPNWQSTDNAPGEQALPVRIVEKPKQEQKTPAQTPHQPRMRRLSRQPAAIAGMLLAVSIGLSLFFGVDRGAQTTVRITQNGFAPKAITVMPGNTIQWINETDHAHVLQSDALCTSDQRCFSTVTIDPGATATLTITKDFIAGTYPYYSISAEGMEASITVLAGVSGSTPTAAKPSLEQHLAQAAPFEGVAKSSQPSSSGAASSASSSMRAMAFALPSGNDNEFIDITSILTGNAGASSSAMSPTGARTQDLAGYAGSSSARSTSPGGMISQLPVNPYTVNGTRSHPFDAEGKPTTGNASSTNLHSGAPRPIAQPATGPALWITIFATFALLFFATRRALQKPCIE